MKAVVLSRPCKAEELKISEVPIPQTRPGWTLVKIKAFGLNRSELLTRLGQSKTVKLPRILGIECVGEVADPSDSNLKKGQCVLSMMGGLGREFDGGYAQYSLIPNEQVYPLERALTWEELAAMPEMYYTAWGSLVDTLRIKQGETLLIRGGTSSVGIAAIQIAKAMGAVVAVTTRTEDKADMLRLFGADIVFIDDDTLAHQVSAELPCGADKILELVGTKTLASSFQYLKKGGIVCVSGILGGEWELANFAPMDFIPSGSYLTIFDSQNVSTNALQAMFTFLQEQNIHPVVAKVFHLEEIAQAHLLMESNTASGKIIIMTS
jgi:NADPH:quinone reductase-like Zn-dependent oxidoreductase